ncbi:MAG TPA: class I SAM-dependent methyltransferase [Caulobacteraceae bacterium]
MASVSGGDPGYAAFHAKRFDYLEALARRLAPPEKGPAVLDIGVGPFAERLRQGWGDVTTLGLPVGVTTISGAPHVPYDLMTAGRGAPIPTDRRFDLVIFAEVIEHLYLEPQAVLAALRPLLKPDGRLIVQTPNAASLVKRLALALGIHPYDPLRTDPDNPGHVREYTRAELTDALETAGFRVLSHAYASYFPRPEVRGVAVKRRLLRAAQHFVPAFRDGQTIVAAPA